jgi:SAM-dependent methyltransferase
MKGALQASRVVVLDRCPLCAGMSFAAITDAEVSGFEWVRCACGLVYKRSQRPASGHDVGVSLGDAPGQAELREADARAGNAEGGTGHYEGAYFDRYARRRRRRIAKSRTQILDALEAAEPGRLLDVGCSLGYALEAARSLGLDAVGVDLSERAVAECRRLGFDARSGTLESLPFEDASFAVVLLKHVFEHTPTPREAAAELRRVLAPGGAAFFAVPNAEYFKAARRPRDSRFFRGEAGLAHCVCYSPDTLARLLEEEGFRVVSVHPRLWHRRGPAWRQAAELSALPLRLPARAAASALGLRKEFWMVAVRR